MAVLHNVQSDEANYILNVIQTLGCVNADQLKFLFGRMSGGVKKHPDIRPVLSYMIQSRQLKFYGVNSDIIIPYFAEKGDSKQILCNWVAMDMFYNKKQDTFEANLFLDSVTNNEPPSYLLYTISGVLYNLSYADSANISKLLLIQERYFGKLGKIKEEYRDNYVAHNCNVFVTSNPDIKREIAQIGITMPHKIAVVDLLGKEEGRIPAVKYFSKK